MPNAYGQFMQRPLVPQQAIQGLQDSLTEPHLDQSPTMARIKGFGAGALDGLRSLTTPESLMAIGGLAMGARGGGEMPSMPQEGPALGLPQFSQLAPRSHLPVQETLGEVHPDFTPMGGEGLFNAARKSPNTPFDPAALGYDRIYGKGGR